MANVKIIKDFGRRYWLPLLVCVIGVLGCGFILLAMFDFDVEEIKGHVHALLDMVSQVHPVVLLLAIAILPCIGVPVSPMLVAGGLAYGIEIGLIVGYVGMMLNNALSYFIAAFPLRRFIEGLLHRYGWKLPNFPKKEEVRVIIVFRITPGLPLPIQNFILGLARVHFGKYMLYSILAQSLPIIAFTVTGGSIFEGSVGLIILGVILVVVMTLVAKIAYGMVGSKFNLKGETETVEVEASE